MPGPEALAVVGSDAHHAIAAAIADKTVTLVKDTQHNLPLTPETHPRIRLYGISGGATSPAPIRSATCDIVQEELEAPASRCTSSRPPAARGRRARRA